MLRRYVTVAAALAVVVLAGLVPAAETAVPESNRRALVRDLQAAYALELRAAALIRKDTVVEEKTQLALSRSEALLTDVLQDLSLPQPAVNAVKQALDQDRFARQRSADPVWRLLRIEDALRAKAQALGALLPQPSSGAPQCADGRDNDGDKTVDAIYDSGCTNAKDGSEGSPLTCRLVVTPGGGAYLVQGTCSGPFFKVEIIAPPGAKLDTKRAPVVAHDRACGFANDSRLGCLMSDGAANPGHVIHVRLWGKTPQAARSLKVRVTDFAGRSRTWKPSQEPAVPPAKPFTLGPVPVDVAVTYANGQGGCPGVATSFTAAGQLLAPGDGTLTYTLPRNQVAKGPIDPKGSFQLSNANETYVGKITGSTATGTYTYNANGCLERYDVSFVLDR